MSIGRILIGHLDYRFLHLRSYPVFDTRLTTSLLPEAFETVFLIGCLDVVKVLP